MSDLCDTFKSRFPVRLRDRGDLYSRQGRVELKDISAESVWAMVRGSSQYEVVLEQDAEVGGLQATCTCPYFERETSCKHIWAVMRELDELKDDDFDDDFEPDFEPDFADTMPILDSPLRAAKTRHKTLAEFEWHERFSLIERYGYTENFPQNTTSPESELHYFLDLQRLFEGAFLVLLRERRRKQNGAWGVLRAYTFHTHNLTNMKGEDQALMAKLYTAESASSTRHFSYRNYDHFSILPELVGSILPELLDSGRCYITRGDTPRSELPCPLANALDEHWEFELVGEETPAGLALKGRLTRGEQSEPLSAPLAIVASGWIVWPDRVTRFDTETNFGWIIMLRELETMQVDGAEIDEWLGGFHGLPRNPRIALPPKFSMEEVTPSLQPVFKLEPMAHDPRRPFQGRLSFRYDEMERPQGDTCWRIPVPGERSLLVRDRTAETECVNTLIDHGYDMRGPIEIDPRMEIMPTWTPPAQTVASTIADLAQRGWELYISEQKVRSGSVSMSVSSGIDWFGVELEADFEGLSVDTPALLTALEQQSGFVPLTDGSLGVLLRTEETDRIGVLSRLGTQGEDGLRFRLPQFYLLDALLGDTPGVAWDQKAAQTRDRMRTHAPVDMDPPSAFCGTLRDYQRQGLGWLHYLRELQLGGCLADDMGLGKTVQALALLLERSHSAGRPSLIVIPRSLIFNWCDETQRFAPDLRVLVHHGTGRSRDGQGFASVDIVFTTYGTMRQDILMLKEQHFDYIILDEAQAIKNASAATSKAARLLKADHRLAMSGTPIENHLGELWSLFEFLNPGLLGASSWLRDGSARKEMSDEDCALISQSVRPFFLRRTKEQVASELPPKTEETIFCELPSKQRKLYDELRDHYKMALADKIETQGLGRSRIMVLEALLRLRQTACHPALVDDTRTRVESGKLTALLELISDIVPAGHKVLVFSQFTKMLGLVRKKLDSSKTRYAYLDGRTRDRQARVREFQEDPDCPVFLISLKAGGVGLNLTAADYVILLDPWWNPAVESQAIDRAHRIGQERHVFAYRLVAKDTVEEKILELQRSKKDLADAIITQANSLASRLTEADLDLLLS